MINRHELDQFFKQFLKTDEFSDYGPNGLQIEGAEFLSKIAFAVSATRASIEEAVDQQAQALVVHHGLFWSFHGARTITGAFARRVMPLIKNDMNLFGFHLPLDAHPEVGNAAILGNMLGVEDQQAFGDFKGSPTGIQGRLKSPISASTLQQRLRDKLEHEVILASPDEQAAIQSIGIITGGANSEWRLAAETGLDAYITGEISEHDWHESQEAGVHMFAGGHHATEQFGIQALMQKVQDEFNLECFYIPSDNPA